MANEYIAIPTILGLDKIQQAIWAQETFETYYLAYGDGGGSFVEPDPSRTTLINQVGLVELDSKVLDLEEDVEWFNAIIPASDPPCTIRELGIFTVDMELIVIANCPDIVKTQVNSGALIDIPLSIGVKTAYSKAITIPIQPSDRYATKNWVVNTIHTINEVDGGTFDPST